MFLANPDFARGNYNTYNSLYARRRSINKRALSNNLTTMAIGIGVGFSTKIAFTMLAATLTIPGAFAIPLAVLASRVVSNLVRTGMSNRMSGRRPERDWVRKTIKQTLFYGVTGGVLGVVASCFLPFDLASHVLGSPMHPLQHLSLTSPLSAQNHAPLQLTRNLDSLRPVLTQNPHHYHSHISSPFGWRHDPITGEIKMHRGVDLAAPIGTPIHAATNGTIEKICFGHGYGRYILLNNGSLSTAYAHMGHFADNLYAGEHIGQGQVLGYVGRSGRTTGPNLHFELIKNGKSVDPIRNLAMNDSRLVAALLG